MPYCLPWRLTSLCNLNLGNERHLMLVVKRHCDELATEICFVWSLPQFHLEEQAQLVAPIVLQVVAGVQVLIQVLQATSKEMSGDS